MVIDELFSPQRLGSWVESRTPAGRPELVLVAVFAGGAGGARTHDRGIMGNLVLV
jgi:hypothetical protein